MIDYVTKIQHPGETWRYSVRTRETDTSVMSWILLACVSGERAGLDVPDQIYVCCSWWLDRATEPLPDNETFEIFSVPITGPPAAGEKLSGNMAPGGKAFSFAISPDSSRVVYRADQEIDAQFNIYSAPLDGSQAAKKLNLFLLVVVVVCRR